jgi:hypothetical protein
MPIPDFREDGYLPEGLHKATEAEVLFRFGSPTRRRRQLALRLRHWLYLARAVHCRRFVVDGSFVTAKPVPGDLDAVVLVSDEFGQESGRESEAAIDLEEILMTRRHGDLFATEDVAEFSEWVEFFTSTRETDGRHKGVVEVLL